MKRIFKKLIGIKLFVLARLQLRIARPYVIAIVGTMNRSLVKDVLKDVLGKTMPVLTNASQWNAEIGIPLTILRTNVVAHSVLGWILTIWKAAASLFRGGYPSVIIVEVAFNARGDMAYMRKLLQPDAVIINDMQPLSGRSFVHEKEELEQEYLAMSEEGGPEKLVIFNTELPEREKVRRSTKRTVVEYSIDGDAPYNASANGTNILVTTPSGKALFQTNIPGKAVQAGFAIAMILKEKMAE